MNDSTSDKNSRFQIAKTILIVSIVGIFSLAFIAIIFAAPDKRNETTMMVFNVSLPLLGTWVGTVLAYYFSKENFESASKSVREMAKQTSQTDRLSSIKATDKMITRSEMDCLVLKNGDEVSMTLKDLRGYFKKNSRLPVLGENGEIKYVIHRSLLDKYETNLLHSGKSIDEISAITLEQFLNDNNKEVLVALSKSFAAVNENSSLADAKTKIDRYCQDVFITKTGASNEPVIGWITDKVIIAAGKQ